MARTKNAPEEVWGKRIGGIGGAIGGSFLPIPGGTYLGSLAGGWLGGAVGRMVDPWFEPDKPDIPTRGSVGLEGDAAMAATAKFYQQQLARQLGTEIGNINVQYGGAGRYTSGQRLGAISEAQRGARAGYGNFLSQTALQRYLAEQSLQAQADIAQMQMEGQAGAGRTQMFGQGMFSLANIFAQNPQYLEWLWNQGGSLLGGGNGGGGSAGLTTTYAGLR